MSATRVTVLTPPGKSALAVLGVTGPAAASVMSQLFEPANGKQLDGSGRLPQFWFGKFGGASGDEIILVRKSSESFEVHCHGGRRVVELIVAQLGEHGVRGALREYSPSEFTDADAAKLLPLARTVRIAAILLDQAHGAYAKAVGDLSTHRVLRRNVSVGRHLTEPWRVAIAGAPNVGKSTLLNALAGFTRSVVSPIPGTTRDAVAVLLAFDGWPVDVIDTAGLRDAPDQLEEEGIRRATDAIQDSDLCLWLVDGTVEQPPALDELARDLGVDQKRIIVVVNKIDLVDTPTNSLRISAAMGTGLEALIAAIIATLVPNPPKPGEPVPFTPDRCDRWS